MRLYLSVCLLLLALAGCRTQPYVNAHIESVNAEYRQLEDYVYSLEEENARLQQETRAVEHRLQELQSEVASLTSLEHVDVEARNSLGMVDATSHLYVQVDQSLKGR